MLHGNGKIIYERFIQLSMKNGRSFKSWDKISIRGRGCNTLVLSMHWALAFMSMSISIWSVISITLLLLHVMIAICMYMLAIVCDQCMKCLWGHRNTLTCLGWYMEWVWYSWHGPKQPPSQSYPINSNFQVTSLTKVELCFRLLAWQCTLKKSCSTWLEQQLLFFGHELIRYLTWSFRAHKNQQCNIFWS